MNPLKDSTGNDIEIGDIVVYADRWPKTAAYIGKVSHVTKESSRLAICRPATRCINPNAHWKDRIYEVDNPLVFMDKADSYRDSDTVVKI